eukprot:2087602-Lingulodinium_polyedra.AAC.1
MPEFTLWASTVPKGIAIIEICGGEGRPSQVCLRRHLKVGLNFDLRCGFDLLKPANVSYLWKYVQQHKPFIAMMGPPRTPFGPWAYLNRAVSPVA